jgi:hypothetical protein
MRVAIYKNYLLITLIVIVVFNNIGRLALGEWQNIWLDLTGRKLWLLSEIVFALCYSVMTVLIARWVACHACRDSKTVREDLAVTGTCHESLVRAGRALSWDPAASPWGATTRCH